MSSLFGDDFLEPAAKPKAKRAASKAAGAATSAQRAASQAKRGAKAAAADAELAEGPVAPRLYARVAPPIPVEGLFSYSVPERLAEGLVPGMRVTVPFGAQKLSAMVVAVDDQAPPKGVRARPLIGVVEPEPVVGADLLALSAWVASRTGCSLGEALDATLPRAVKTGRTQKTVEHAVLVRDLPTLKQAVDYLQEKQPKQARVLRILGDRGGNLPTRELMSLAQVSRSPLQTLARDGELRFERVRPVNDPLMSEPVARTEPHELGTEQAEAMKQLRLRLKLAFAMPAPAARATEAGGAALEELIAEGRRRARSPRLEGATPAVLLHGVTGSGKTEVYLQLLADVVERGRQGIVLVPEISLTPQTVRRFRERFERVAVLHSHLTDAERHEQWLRIRAGEADVVVGARSAVFAPVPKLGLVILDEEQETSFKQNNVPRYHAREVAIERARLAGGLAILGTATPSLETERRARDGEIPRLVLSERMAGGRTPEIQLVDLTIEERRHGFSLISDQLRAAMDNALGKGGQVILFLNRRGWSPVMLCRGCRSTVKCPDCAVAMTLHKRVNRVLCHYCGTEQAPPVHCPNCSEPLTPLGFGTEKVEDEVRRAFPGHTTARMDSDTMTGRGAHESVLSAFARGEVSVLVGTQMIAKGLDFPNATLVGVLCADSALFLPDYRASERTFQLLAQVVGRTGRGPQGGRVVVQAYDPRHEAIRTGVAQDHDAFSRAELKAREELGYPPYGRLLRVVVQGEELSATEQRARDIVQHLITELGASVNGVLAGETPEARSRVELLGPAPAPIPRLQRRHRIHMVAKCRDDEAVGLVLDALEGQLTPARGVRALLDVDPLSML
ncbi:MAG: primosomal protein N' [Planctomycetota bacterium]|nr:MAG: primosomal protein N' [Planctomycetota bacterium]